MSLPLPTSDASVTGQIAIPPPRASRSSFYRPELDALRFFAFLAVFRFHFSAAIDRYVEQGGSHWIGRANSVTHAGVYGVDLFFVLSAYLITELLLREKRQFGHLDVRAFYVRRILRIWPLYFFAIGLALFPPFNRLHGFTWRYAGAFLLLAGNWSVWHGAGHFTRLPFLCGRCPSKSSST
jgi:peptidoglycan/LPS O-acetylase OafA/YrhL